MKQIFLCSILLFAIAMENICKAQITISSSTAVTGTFNFYVNIPGIIQYQASASNNSSASVPANSRVMWLEYGDGGFTIQPNTNRIIGNTAGNAAFNTPGISLLVTNKLYDTGDNQIRIATQLWGERQTCCAMLQLLLC